MIFNHQFISKICLFLALYLIVSSVYADDYEWQDLFNGKDLNNWTTLNGSAEYIIDSNVIVGTAKLGTANTFLATRKHYSDFIFEFEVNVDNRLNTGVQIRSLSDKNYRDGRVHGYQVEIDPSTRNYTGGIYDEARRKWLYPMAVNSKGRVAFRNGEWNAIRVEAIGNTIRTWVNGVMCANLVDAMDTRGFIALQVHSIKHQNQAGAQVRWRNLRIKTKNLESARWAIDPQVRELSYLVNTLTDWEKRQGFRLLWDGKTTKGWRGAKLNHFPKSGWQINKGILTVLATDGGESTGPGDIITTDKFGNFELELEFKITEGANSGIKYYVDPELNKGAGSAIGLEFQILDDNKHPDAKRGVKGNRTLGSAYDLIASKNLSNSNGKKSKLFKGIGEWNKARIISRDGKIEHWLNNEKVVEFDRYSHIFEALVNYSKYKDWPNFGRLPQGHILLQDHGDTVHFRSIKIREF